MKYDSKNRDQTIYCVLSQHCTGIVHPTIIDTITSLKVRVIKGLDNIVVDNYTITNSVNQWAMCCKPHLTAVKVRILRILINN